MSDVRIAAVALVTERALQLLGVGFSRAWPVDESPCFQGLLEAIDEADRQIWRARDAERRQEVAKELATPTGIGCNPGADS